MRINSVVLDNYGPYSGMNRIDLVPRGRGARPIVLIGGMNGAGKTTLLDAVRLALYGKLSLGDRVSEKEYQAHLRGRVHRSRNSLVCFDYARVGVEFDFVLSGKRETYYVQRCWSLRNGNGVDESFQVFRRDETSRDGDYNNWPTLLDLEPQHWQAFVSDVVPERLSQLFFFDGEKIKRIADDASGDAAIAESVRSLLGLDTVNRLRADLGILATREAKRHLGEDEASALERVEGQIEELSRALRTLAGKRAELESAISGATAEVARLQRQFVTQGGTFAENQQLKRERQAVLEVEIEGLQRQVRQECEGLFPLALCPSVTKALIKQIESERHLRRQVLVRNEMRELEVDLVREIESSNALNKGTIRDEIIRIVKESITRRAGDGQRDSLPSTIIGLSEAEAARVLDALRDAREVAAKTMRLLSSDLEGRERETQEIRRQLDRAPEQLVLEPLFRDLAERNRVLGQRQEELKSVDERRASLANELAAKERERERLLAKSKEGTDVKQRLAIVEKAQGALDIYLTRLTRMKVDALCGTVTECFNRLSHKRDSLHAVTISPDIFEVELHDKSGHVIPREELSAGEKQILAIAILWGLGRTSGRPLPVIIDTPLGRLDSDHRMNLVRNYYPHAGHQVILLSTDTEVDKTLFVELKPYVSHCYHLVYDKEEGRTYPKEEYFWKEKSDG